MPDPITLADARASLPASLAAIPDAQVQSAIDAASTAMARYCGRSLALDSFDEEYTPGTTRLIFLQNYPVVSVARICTDLSTALTIQAAPGAWRATVQWDPTAGLTLVQVGGANPGTVIIAPTAFPTTTALVAQINATPGWTATASTGLANCPPTEYRTQGALGAMLEPVTLAAYATDLDRYDLTAKNGKLVVPRILPSPYVFPARTWGVAGHSTYVRVVYQAGFAAIPADLAEACRVAVLALLEGRAVAGIYKSEDLGNTSYTLADVVAGLPQRTLDLLNMGGYRKRRF